MIFPIETAKIEECHFKINHILKQLTTNCSNFSSFCSSFMFLFFFFYYFIIISLQRIQHEFLMSQILHINKRQNKKQLNNETIEEQEEEEEERGVGGDNKLYKCKQKVHPDSFSPNFHSQGSSFFFPLTLNLPACIANLTN